MTSNFRPEIELWQTRAHGEGVRPKLQITSATKLQLYMYRRMTVKKSTGQIQRSTIYTIFLRQYLTYRD